MENDTKFDCWAIVEIMGHQKYAGRVTEQVVAGSAFLRIDIPATGDKPTDQPAFTKLFGASSVYAITPTTEELARGVAANLRQAPIGVYDLPEAMREKLRALPAPKQSQFGWDNDDNLDPGDEPEDDEDEGGPF